MRTKTILEHDVTTTPSASNIIATDLIQELINNYRNNQLRAINSKLGLQDSHSIWFDLPKLKKFIACIEDEAKKVNSDTSEIDLGIRFYYAAYPKAENWAIMGTHPVAQEYAERHTLVMIPTIKREDETGQVLHYDFNPMNGTQGGSMALSARNSRTSSESIAENHGALIPPEKTTVEQF